MEGKKITKLPDNWEDMIFVARVCWFIDHFGTDEDDENGQLIYDTDSMTEEILEAYENTIEYSREMRKKGFLID